MNDLAAILEAYDKADAAGEAVALATVVRVTGSAFRRPGARMLIVQDQRAAGSISAGCLEKDVIARAQRVMQSGEPVVLHYSTTGTDDEIIFGVGAGCNGSVTILVEPARPLKQLDLLQRLNRCQTNRSTGVLCTVVSGSSVGSKLFMDESEKVSTIIDPDLQALVLELAEDAQDKRHSSFQDLYYQDRKIETFIELIEPPVALFICGNGKDAQALTAVASKLGWQVGRINPRHDDIAGILEPLRYGNRAACVLMTHNYQDDLLALKVLAQRDRVGYVGLLGPKHRAEKLLQELIAQNITFTDEQRLSLFAPVGLDLGAESESEIAVAIVAEIMAVINNRSGGFLRNRKGFIHAESHQSLDFVDAEMQGV